MDVIPAVRRVLLPLFAAMYVACAVYVMVPFVAGCVGSGYTGLDTYPYGTPSRPMVYRVVMPAVIKAVRASIPGVIERPVTEKLVQWRDSEEGRQAVKKLFFRKPPLADNLIFESAVAACVCFLTLLAFLWMFYIFARTVFPESTAYALLAPLLFLQMLPGLVINNAYIYDFAELFFACALFTLLHQRRWRLYLATFALATLNKETTVFTIIFFASWFYCRIPLREFLRLLAAQCAIYLLIKGGLNLYFAGYPGELIGPHVTVKNNLRYLVKWGDYQFLIMFVVMMFYRWWDKPAFLRASLPMILVHTAIYITLCVAGEYRDFYWSMPFMILMITHSLVAGVGIADHPVFFPAPRKKNQPVVAPG